MIAPRDARAVALVAREWDVTEEEILSQPASYLEARAAMAFAVEDLRDAIRQTWPGRLAVWLADRLGHRP